MKVADLSGAELAYWVAMAEGLESPGIEEIGTTVPKKVCEYIGHYEIDDDGWWTDYEPHEEWEIAGPIIESYFISLMPVDDGIGKGWMAYMQPRFEQFGETPLVAAMRCYVASVYGEEVSQPPEEE